MSSHPRRPQPTAAHGAAAPEAGRQPRVAGAPTLSLPKGGGAIRGMGEKFAANPVTGTGSLTVPIAISPGRSGFQPQLTLSYDSGAGNGPFGLGWSLGLPSITRKTDKGLPRYRDSEASDVFLLSGAEDLVPLLVHGNGEGAWRRHRDERRLDGVWRLDGAGSPEQVDGLRYRVERFRPRTEGLFARIERWTELATGEIHWRSISRDNVTTLYGRTAASRIADPERPERVFSWLICASYDGQGNVIVYEYAPEDGADVDPAATHERHRTPESRSANRYPKRIRYGNGLSRLARPELYRKLFDLGTSHLDRSEQAELDWHFEVVFDYGEGHLQPLTAEADDPRLVQASADASQAWLRRQDPFSSYRAAFEVRTYRLCRRILMFHHFPGELGRDDCLVRSTELDYRQGPIASCITGVTQSGYAWQADGSYLQASLPALELDYTPAIVHHEVRDVDGESLENLPGGLDGRRHQWIDLDGEGITGVLTEQADAWFYKRNLSPIPQLSESGEQVTVPRFGALEPVGAAPSSADLPASGRFLDLAGDGQLDLVHLERRPLAGFYERLPEAGWEPFRSFTSWPGVAWDDPNLRFVDLTGDGHADVLIAEDEIFTWYPSLGEEGFGPAESARFAADDEQGPRLVFADGTQSVYLADLSGDGLTDLVRIRNGELCYWPNLGYGRFGSRVTMDGAPWFEEPDLFDQGRIRLADIDGSGVTDILYLGRGGVDLYFNHSGNAWSDAVRVGSFPPVDPLSSVMVADLLGNGTACLVWSSALPGEARRPMRYIDLMGGEKPHLLVRASNGMGAETRVRYAPSTRFYLEDKAAGKPWITRLPFPVHVVERVETRDRVSRNRFITRYAYHHGYFDGHEREFRGFGRVDQWDTEQYALLAVSGELEEASEHKPENLDAASHVPPVMTKTWFHTGVYRGRAAISRQYADEYFGAPEPDAQDREAALAAFEKTLLPDTLLPAGVRVADGAEATGEKEISWELSAEEQREACRALRGTMLRQEVYAPDGTSDGAPYTVSEQNASLVLLQPEAGNRHAVVFSHPRETISYHYERRPEDPRIGHQVIFDVDRFGNVRRSATVGYGRQTEDLELSPADRKTQAQIHVTSTQSDITDDVDVTDPDPLRDAYRLPLPWQERTYELTEQALAPAVDSPWRLTPGGEPRFDFEALRALCDGAAVIGYHEPPSGGLEKRLIEHGRTRFRADELTAPLAFGRLESRALPYESYQLALTPDLLERLYQPDVGEPLAPLVAEGGSVQLDGHPGWWIPSGQVFYSPGDGDGAAYEREWARNDFFLPRRFVDPFGGTTRVAYDAYDLLVAATEDPLGNTAAAENDYRVLQPCRMTGPNGNRSEVAFDALGLVAGTALRGKENEGVGDSLAGFRADLTGAEIDAFFADPRGPTASTHLGSATARIVYDLDRYQRFGADSPAFAATVARETHAADSLPPEGLKIQVGFSYSDGFGREIQKKAQAEPGRFGPDDPDSAHADPRWVASGWTVFNNKGKPVRQYEPFFDDTHDFRFGRKVGVSPTLFYDPVGRVVATLHPNHTYEKVVFDAWRQETWDANDTIHPGQRFDPWFPEVLPDPAFDPAADPDVGHFFQRLASEDYLPTWSQRRRDPAERLATWPDQDENGHPLPRNAQIREAEHRAATKAAEHAATPSVAHLDALGRTFLTVADNGIDGGKDQLFETHVDLDIEGNQRAVRDALGRTVMEYDYDMSGNRRVQRSIDAGARWSLANVAGNTIYAWDERQHRFRTEYDELQRPTHLWVRKGTEPEILAERTVYGEAHPQAEAHNLRGQVLLRLDGAGLVRSGGMDPETERAFDFKGNLLRGSRRLARDYRERVDWKSAEIALGAASLDLEAVEAAVGGLLELASGEPEPFTTSTTYDALDRIVTHTQPDGSVTRPGYNEANLLEEVHVHLGGSEAWTPFVENIDYDAKGQRVRIVYGCGGEEEGERVFTEYTYDELTFRLTRLRTVRPIGGAVLQDLSYAYDPVGNITSIRDDAQQTVYFNNSVVEPDARYTYDAVYRLVRAVGREHVGQSSDPAHNHPEWKPHYDFNDSTRTGLGHPHDGGAMRNYAQDYGYDAIGNIRTFTHSPKGGQRWIRHYQYEPESNRLDSTSLPGDDPDPANNSGGRYGARYQHDAHGNMTSMPHLPTLCWDFEDQMQRVDLRGGGTVYFTYDAAGERVRKVHEHNGALVEERVYLGGFEIYRKRTNGTLQLERETLHVMDDEQRIALVETRTHGIDGSPPQLIRFQLGNHLGSASLELDDGARILSYEEYHPYGSTSYQAAGNQTETPKRYRYTGKERDEETGLYYHGARYYAPWLARWTAADPAGLVDGTGVYNYVRGSPQVLLDPSGTNGSAWDRVRRARQQTERRKAADMAMAGYEPTGGSAFAGATANVGVPASGNAAVSGEDDAPLEGSTNAGLTLAGKGSVGDGGSGGAKGGEEYREKTPLLPFFLKVPPQFLRTNQTPPADAPAGLASIRQLNAGQNVAVASFSRDIAPGTAVENLTLLSVSALSSAAEAVGQAGALANAIKFRPPGALGVAEAARAGPAGSGAYAARGSSGTTPMDPKRLARIRETVKRQDVGWVQGGSEATERLGSRAAAYDPASSPGRPGTIVLRENPTEPEVFEELRHFAEHRKKNYPTRSAEEIALDEIDTQRWLDKFGHKRGWTQAELDQTMKNLEGWYDDLYELIHWQR